MSCTALCSKQTNHAKSIWCNLSLFAVTFLLKFLPVDKLIVLSCFSRQKYFHVFLKFPETWALIMCSGLKQICSHKKFASKVWMRFARFKREWLNCFSFNIGRMSSSSTFENCDLGKTNSFNLLVAITYLIHQIYKNCFYVSLRSLTASLLKEKEIMG